MAKLANPDLNAAIVRFCETVDMDAIDALVGEVPEEAYGRIVLSEDVKQTRKKLVCIRLEEGFAPLHGKLKVWHISLHGTHPCRYRKRGAIRAEYDKPAESDVGGASYERS